VPWGSRPVGPASLKLELSATVAPTVLNEFLQGLEDNLSLLSAEERSSISDFIDSLDDSLSLSQLQGRLSGFLNRHQDLDRKLIPSLHPLPLSEAPTPEGWRVAGIAPTPNAKEFKSQIRNIMLRPTTPPPKDGGSQPKR
jgi:hypothetical protein